MKQLEITKARRNQELGATQAKKEKLQMKKQMDVDKFKQDLKVKENNKREISKWIL